MNFLGGLDDVGFGIESRVFIFLHTVYKEYIQLQILRDSLIIYK